MSGPSPPFSTAPWRSSSDMPSEHHLVPPPGVMVSTAPPSFAWRSPVALAPPGTSPGIVSAMYPLQPPIIANQAMDATSQFSGGAFPHHTQMDAAHTSPGYGVRYSTYGPQTTSYGTHGASFATWNVSSVGSHEPKDHSYGAQSTNSEPLSCGTTGSFQTLNSLGHTTGTLQSSMSPSTQNYSSLLQTAFESNVSHANCGVQLQKADPKSLLADLKGLVTQANDAVQKVTSLMSIKLSALPRKGLNPQVIVHSTKSALESIDSSTNSNGIIEGTHKSNGAMTAHTVFEDIMESLKANDSCYKDAPGVAQVPVFAETGSLTLPDFAKGERWAELTSSQNIADGDQPSRNTQAQGALLLPSTFLLLRKELSTWKDFHFKCTSALLQVAANLGMVGQDDLKRWLFTHASGYGVAYRRSLLEHIVVLLVFCLRAVSREATTLKESASASTESREATGLIECRVLSESASWLSAQLSVLSDPAASENMVLGLFKFALEAAAYRLTILARDRMEDPQEGEGSMGEALLAIPEQRSPNHSSIPLETQNVRIAEPSSVGDGVLQLERLAVALLAIRSEGELVKCKACDSIDFQSSSSQRSAVHSMVVNHALEVRATRANFRAVLDHDGLTWQRSQNQDYKKNKTKEELLAEERDYKRRRMSYRGKKVQRTPSEVLRDIIETHMEDIVAAGGIGNFGRMPQNIQLAHSESDLSASGTRDCTGTEAKRSANRDAQGKELGKLYSAHSQYSRSESRGGEGYRSSSVSLSSSSRRNEPPSDQTRHERSRHESSSNRSYEREYDRSTKRSRWEDRERSSSGKRYSSRYDSSRDGE